MDVSTYTLSCLPKAGKLLNFLILLNFLQVGEKFRSRALKFPGLISGCTIDWFSKWPEDALIEVSSHFLMSYPVVASQDVKNELVLIMAEIQDGVSEYCNQYFNRFRRRTFVTPKTFISFLGAYKVLYKKKLEDINMAAMRMKTGLKKLVEAQASVDELKKELSVKEIQVNEATEKAEAVSELNQSFCRTDAQWSKIPKGCPKVENVGFI